MKRKMVVSYVPGRLASEAPALESVATAPDAEVLAEITRVLQLIDQAQRAPGVMASVQDPLASLLQTRIAQFAEESQMDEVGDNVLEVKFDEHDILGWAGSLFSWLKRLRKEKWRIAPATPDPLPNQARLAMFGDWACGLYGAPVVSHSISNDAAGFDVVLHLGDTYYSGDSDEIRDRLLGVWPNAGRAVSRACNGNHEMYTGGRAYFRAVEESFRQPASYFAFQNDHWLLAALDTAYKDHDLHEGQVAWLDALLAAAGDRKLILFTHHQPFSLLDKQGPMLIKRMSRLLTERRIFAWYWGHEHRCVLYDPHPAWGLLGRCVGHGGFPYFREGPKVENGRTDWARVETRNLVPGGLVLDGPNPHIPGEETRYGPHGYATLRFDGPRVEETIHAADGEVLHSVELV